ncbi:MAG: polyprenyl synthetase family protein [Pseudohongiellaceae bacterium]
MYQQLRAVVEADFLAVNKFIVEQLHSHVPLVEDIGHYIVEAGGKRLRPLLVLLAARSCGLRGEQHIPMAAVIEFIHTATLLHDDVVDMSSLRRGRPTVNAQWNNPSSVLVGDFIYSRAFQILVEIGDMRVMKIMADTTNRIAEGEVLQLISKSNPDADQATYMQVIQSKTAILFQAAAQCGAILADAEDAVEDSFTRFGMHLGTAFQLIDDVLDYAGDATALGKNIGDDLAEGKPTLPLIRAMQQSSAAEVALIRDSLASERIERDTLETVIGIVRRSDALDYTRNLAEEQARLARSCLDPVPESAYREALDKLVTIATDRNN